MQIHNEVKLDFCDVLIKPKRSNTASRSKVDLHREYKFLNGGCWDGIPIIASNMAATGTRKMAEALREYQMMTCLHKFHEVEDAIDFFSDPVSEDSFYTTGITDDDFVKVMTIGSDKEVSTLMHICVDVANGYTEFFCGRVKQIREQFPRAIIMAGNVCTPEMVQELLLCGADIVKCGIGGGSCCTTRLVTGVGYPMLSMVSECADAAHGMGGHICSDGGCVTPSDVVKAFAAGADFVMLGGMLAGTDECDGIWQTHADGTKSFRLFGMSSQEAQELYCGGLRDYRAPEGKSVDIPHKGPVKDVLQQILGGLRSACAYVGTDKLKDLSKCTTFIRVNRTHNAVYGN